MSGTGQEFMWLFDADEFDAEASRVLPGGTVVKIMKVGGGTVGQAYEGAWLVVAVDSDGRVSRFPMTSGAPHTHTDMLEMVAEAFQPE